MGIDGVGNGKVIPFARLQENHRAKPAETEPDPRGGSDAAASEHAQTEGTGSFASLSPEARERLLAELKDELNTLPDVRQDKVIEAKLRISTGYYEREEIRREILRSVLQSLRSRTDAPENAPPAPPPAGAGGAGANP
jgi:hypothetical protein